MFVSRLINVYVVILSWAHLKNLLLYTFIILQNHILFLKEKKKRKEKMAQLVVFNLAGKVIELLSPLIREEIKLACCLKADLVNLKSTVSIIKDVLLDAEKQAHHRAVVKDWLEKLQDVLHDADDVLDDVATEALQRNVMAGNKMTKEIAAPPTVKSTPFSQGWWRNSDDDDDDDDDNEPHHLLLPSFPPSLSELYIWGCPNLTSMPLIPPSLKEPCISGCPLLTATRRKQ
ncbi:uncharacterized protein LOC115984839 [Quercus lobata]|uniref:uncharacterized protein LOC115984839 n=1 Tax=Quercus lobata TaxID=97700 RepID=UPI001244C2A8|nr:uncharacterized protein LOC115984839 [Quercus lobata]